MTPAFRTINDPWNTFSEHFPFNHSFSFHFQIFVKLNASYAILKLVGILIAQPKWLKSVTVRMNLWDSQKENCNGGILVTELFVGVKEFWQDSSTATVEYILWVI